MELSKSKNKCTLKDKRLVLVMIDVEIADIRVESTLPSAESEFGKKGTKWLAWLALDLYDKSQKAAIHEWYYVPVCSSEYINDENADESVSADKVILQDMFDLALAKEDIQSKFSKLEFKSWDDFHRKMSVNFVNDD